MAKPPSLRSRLKPCPYCGMDKPALDSTHLTGAWYCTGCLLRGPANDPDGSKWDSLLRPDDLRDAVDNELDLCKRWISQQDQSLGRWIEPDDLIAARRP